MFNICIFSCECIQLNCDVTAIFSCHHECDEKVVDTSKVIFNIIQKE